MSYILYLSLPWSYEVGSCNIAISVIRAIKWYLFSYRLHFNQISLDYTVVNAESTVPNTVNCAEYTVNCNECTVNCALDIVNRMMSYILYLSLRWSYEVGSCTIAISAITAIKHYLFCYRLDFNQNSLNYTVANAQSTVPNAQSNVPNAHSTGHWTLLTEWCLTSYISVYDGRMKLGVEPLRSVWWQLSNDIYFVTD